MTSARARKVRLVVFMLCACSVVAGPGAVAASALPNTSTPSLSLAGTIQTSPFVGSSTSIKDGEGSAYVPNSSAHPNIGGTDSLWLADDNGRTVWEVDPYSGELKTFVGPAAWAATGQYSSFTGTGTGALATIPNYSDIESMAYDRANDMLYVFSGKCCTSSVKPTVFRLVRAANGSFRPESYQPLAAGSDYTASAWNASDGKIYLGKGSALRTYDYPTNTPGPTFSITGLNSILGLGFSDDGADLFAVTANVRLFRATWATKTLTPGWSFDLTQFNVLDSRAVELINDRFYVFDGYDGRSSGNPLRHAVFVFDVCCGSQPPPVASFTATQAASPPLTMRFTDTSTGGPTSWSWTFGDGTTSTLQSPTHTYGKAGTYTVTLLASNANGTSTPVTQTVTVTAPPVPTASFSVSQLASPPLTVQVTDTSTGGPTAWSWTFGDGGASTLQNPTHTYASSGTYTIGLVASNANGPSEPFYQTVTVTAQGAPTASFTVSVTPPLTVQLTDTSTGGPDAWSWTFGDGNTSTAQSPTHTYAAAGTYTITLQASNASGSSFASQTVNVGVPSQTVFTATADSYVSLTSSTSNFGTAKAVRVKTASGNEFRSYFTFTVSGLTGQTITSARLRLFVTDPSASGGSVFSTASTWIETGVGGLTWSNQPGPTGAALSTLGPVGINTFVELDVTAAVSGDGTYSFVITSSIGDVVYYASRESANAPQLVVDSV